MTYPIGAIRTSEELRCLGATATARNPVHLYSVCPSWYEIGKVIVRPGTGWEYRREGYAIIVSDVKEISITYFNIDAFHKTRSFIFSNYWFAWAYFMHLKQGIEERECIT